LSTNSDPTKLYDASLYFHAWAFLPFFVIAGGVLLAGVICMVTAKSWRELILAVYAIACMAIGTMCAMVSFVVVALLPRLMLPTLILLGFAVVVLLLRLDPQRSVQREEAAAATT
jgi:hypothetical protein